MEFAGSDGLLKVGEFELRVEHHLEIAAESLELGIGSLGIQNIVIPADVRIAVDDGESLIVHRVPASR